jgi:DNA-binding LytR/AlgR family response regulator
VKDTPLQLTIRQVKQQISARFLAGLLGVVCILTVSGPFNTAEVFSVIPRFFYWGVIAASTYFLALFITTYSELKLAAYTFSKLKTRIIASTIAAAAVGLLVYFINIAVIGIDEFSWGSFLFSAGEYMLISFAVASICYTISDSKKATAVTQALSEVDQTTSPFFERLPAALGTDIISLRAQDHYVEVTTALGCELILIRLSDAIKELGEDIGIQTHRSWWVVCEHVLEHKRVNGKPCLVLSNDTKIPVSRTYSADVKELLNSKAA